MAAKTPNKSAKISVMLPRMGNAEEAFVLVGINGVLTQIPRGKPVMVSKAVYYQLRQSESVKELTESFHAANDYNKLNM